MPPPLVVLDTNVVLDWFVFGNPSMVPIAQAIQSGSLRWLGCAAMRAELAHVLQRAPLGGHAAQVEHVLTSVDRLMEIAPVPHVMPVVRLRCSDPQDQVFFDLALANGAQWLLSRDRAVLKLARKTRPQGLAIMCPEEWKLPLA